ncbi:MAG TPA: hypothetical protein VLW54_11555 [Candidatus Acidoferrales bacterium]|nr:hypothetical protein [Candidatus Acidoferrales bacterium]
MGKIAALGVMVLLLGCSALAEREPFPYSRVSSSCAPWDGPAIDISLSTTLLKCGKGDAAEVRMYFWRELPLHDGQTFHIEAKTDWGGASYCKGGEEPCERASAGTIHIEHFDRENGVEGSYELAFPKRGKVSGLFHAEWCHQRVMCG